MFMKKIIVTLLVLSVFIGASGTVLANGKKQEQSSRTEMTRAVVETKFAKIQQATKEKIAMEKARIADIAEANAKKLEQLAAAPGARPMVKRAAVLARTDATKARKQADDAKRAAEIASEKAKQAEEREMVKRGMKPGPTLAPTSGEVQQ